MIKALQEYKVSLEPKDLKVQQGSKDHKEYKELLEHKGHKGIKAQRGLKDHKEYKE